MPGKIHTRKYPLPVSSHISGHGLLLGWSLEKSRPKAPIGFHYGRHSPGTPQSLSPILHTSQGHLMTFAPTGSGKGVSAVIPALLQHDGPVIVIDPKGENYAVTAKYRQSQGQQIVCLDPFQTIDDGEEDASFNPLDVICPESTSAEDDALTLSEVLSYQTDMRADPFWHIRGKQLLAGMLLHVATSRLPKNRNLTEVATLLSHQGVTLESTFREMKASTHALVRQAASLIGDHKSKMAASILAMSHANLGFLASRQVQNATNYTTFSLNTITEGMPVSLYLIIPPDKMESHAPLLRLWINCLMMQILKRRSKVEKATLFLLDEAAQLGHFPPLKQAITLLRGYGLQTWSFWQDLSQLQRLYPGDWESMYNNCSAHQYFGISTPLLADQVSKLTLYPHYDEILHLDSNEMLLCLAGDLPVIAQRPNYLSDTPFQSKYSVNPYYQGIDLETSSTRHGQRIYHRKEHQKLANLFSLLGKDNQ